MKRVLIFGTLLLSIVGKVIADEGMWLPLLLADKQADMQKNGMKITAEDIYSANKSSLKDAVVLFGRGCTGEFVSSEGLLLTNHHCGYGSIVRHSTVEADYVTNGFWAKNKQEELPCAGMSVTFLVYMKDVTKEVLQGVGDNISEEEREKLIERNIAAIRKKATEGTHYEAVIKPFYYGNQYFMYVNEVFNDVRLVGAPPSNIGKFGGDTDNWMWPRHTGDFSVFRVYADKNNKPAGYSKDNVPYVPKRHLRINLKGAKEGDFTFVFGYPGTTKQFLTSDAVDFVQNMDDPIRIKLRTIRLDVYNRAMNESPAQRLRYASRLAKTSELPILISGGLHFGQPPSEAQIGSETLAIDFNIETHWLEGESRTTWENALYSAKTLQPLGIKKIVLVTDAWHMPRARWSFEQHGFEVISAPMGFFSVPRQRPAFGLLPESKAFWQNSLLLNEWVGQKLYLHEHLKNN